MLNPKKEHTDKLSEVFEQFGLSKEERKAANGRVILLALYF